MIQLVQLAGGRDWVHPEVLVSEVNARRLSRSKEFERVRIQRSEAFTCVVSVSYTHLTLPTSDLV